MRRQGERLVDGSGHPGVHLQRRGEPLLGGAGAQQRVDGAEVAVGAAEDGDELTGHQVQPGVLQQRPAQPPRRGSVLQRQRRLDEKGEDAGPLRTPLVAGQLLVEQPAEQPGRRRGHSQLGVERQQPGRPVVGRELVAGDQPAHLLEGSGLAPQHVGLDPVRALGVVGAERLTHLHQARAGALRRGELAGDELPGVLHAAGHVAEEALPGGAGGAHQVPVGAVHARRGRRAGRRWRRGSRRPGRAGRGRRCGAREPTSRVARSSFTGASAGPQPVPQACLQARPRAGGRRRAPRPARSPGCRARAPRRSSR